MKNNRPSVLAALLLCTAFSLPLAACGDPDVGKDKTVYIGTTAVIEKATRGEYNYDMLASGNSDIPLVRQDSDHEFHPLLADYATEDYKTWTYTVSDGLTWSDGIPVTAEDILFTLQYNDDGGEAVFNDKTSQSTGQVTKKKYDGYSLSDDKMSISLTLSEINLRELSDMASFRVMPKHVYEGKDTIGEADGRVVCGPYVLTQFNKAAGTLTYEVNPYYPKSPNVTKLVYKMFDNSDIMYMALRDGDIDTVWAYSQSVDTAYYGVLKDTKGLDFIFTPAVGVRAVLMFNNSVAPFDDPNIRNAVSYALDYDLYKTMFGSGNASVANRGFVPVSAAGAKETERLARDFQKASEHLAASGYHKADGDKYFKKDGAELGFALTVRSTNATHLRYAELVKNNLEYFGIKVTLDSVDANMFNIKTSNKFSSENGANVSHQAAINGFTEAGMGMKEGFASIYVDKAHPVQGGCQVDDPLFSDILTRMRDAASESEYNAAAGDLQDYYAEAVPLIALYWDNLIYVHSTDLKNISADAVFGINNAESWLNAKK